MSAGRIGFYITPFLPELNFLYLYLQDYLERKHSIRCERADSRVLTMPILEKIREMIIESDLIIADISHRNPNVFYELGLAHAYDKPVILITGDEINETPSDIRHFEFMKYNLNEHGELLRKLDNAVFHLFSKRYRPLYQQGIALLSRFNAHFGMRYVTISEEEFHNRIVKAEQTGHWPEPGNPRREAEFLLPRIINDGGDVTVMRRVIEWIETTFDP